LKNHDEIHKHKHALNPTSGRTRAMPFASQHIFPRNPRPISWLLWLPIPCSGQFKKFKVYKALCNWLAGGRTSSPPFNFLIALWEHHVHVILWLALEDYKEYR
jgi:hypothetical protein